MSDDNNAKGGGTLVYAPIFKRIQDIDKKVETMKTTLDKLKVRFKANQDENIIDDEICIDEVEADKAALEIIKDFYVEQLGNEEPEGEA